MGLNRRAFVCGSLVAALAVPFSTEAQQRAIPTFGILLVFSREAGRTFTEPIRAYMEALGYIEGRSIVFDVRFADGKPERLPALASDLAAQRPAVIATFGDAHRVQIAELPITSQRVPVARGHERLTTGWSGPRTRRPLGSA